MYGTLCTAALAVEAGTQSTSARPISTMFTLRHQCGGARNQKYLVTRNFSLATLFLLLLLFLFLALTAVWALGLDV